MSTLQIFTGVILTIVVIGLGFYYISILAKIIVSKVATRFDADAFMTIFSLLICGIQTCIGTLYFTEILKRKLMAFEWLGLYCPLIVINMFYGFIMIRRIKITPKKEEDSNTPST